MMLKRLQNKTALITGAAAGIGAAAAYLFATEGARVIATDRDAGGLRQFDDLEHVKTAVLDVTDAQQISAAGDQFGRINILFNCAGIVHNGNILECSEQDWDQAFSVNVQSMYRLIRTFLPGMVKHGGGSIINMASVASSIAGVPNRFAYSASKAAVVGLTKSVAADFVAEGIRCNAICPGTIDTPSLGERINQAADPVAARAAFMARQPSGRLGTAEEIAALALYLASDESAYTTGTTHVIDGGWTN
jgi:2-keto-3-deoxy-L-fuconate dehydrogenase